jgi:MraZ protein
MGWSGSTPDRVSSNGKTPDDGQERRTVFLGEDTHSLDDKGRVVLPRRFRDALSDGCIVAKGEDHQLLVFTREAYERKAAEVIAMPSGKTARRVQRIFFSGADEQGLDKAGRLLLKGELRDYANLVEGGEVKVLGVYHHIELWNPATFADDKARGEEDFTRDEEEEDEI